MNTVNLKRLIMILQGNEAWVLELDTYFKDEFNAAEKLPWVTQDGEVAGIVRSAGTGNVTFLAVHEAGWISFETSFILWLLTLPFT